MLRSIQVVNSCSRDHVILVITSSRLANGTHFNADRQFRQNDVISWFMFMLNAPMKITPKFDSGNLIWLNYQNIVESY